MDTDNKSQVTEAEKKYPGAAVDAADRDKVTDEEIKERTAVLDDIPNLNE